MNTLKEKYQKEIKSELRKALSLENEMAVPKLVKIVINSGVGELSKSKDSLEKFKNEIASIAGQMPNLRKSRISVSGFNLRQGQIVGLAVTLRGDKMYSFFEKLVTIVMPRLRDFRGVPIKSFDKFGNYTLGFVEHTVFPEIDLAKVEKPRGLEVIIVTSAKNEKEGKILLEMLGMPFEKG